MGIKEDTFVTIKKNDIIQPVLIQDLFEFFQNESISILDNGDTFTEIVGMNKNSDTHYNIRTRAKKNIYLSLDQNFILKERGKDIVRDLNSVHIEDTIFMTNLNTLPIDTKSFDFRKGQFYGILLGDGSVRSPYYTTVAINYRQLFIYEFLKDVLLHDFKYNDFVLKDGNRCYAFIIRKKQFADIVRSFIEGDSTYDKHVDIKNKSLDFLVGMLDGLMVTDGCYNTSLTIGLVNHAILKDIKSILQIMGVFQDIKISKSKMPNKKDLYIINMPIYLRKFLPLMNQKIPELDNRRRFGCIAYRGPRSNDVYHNIQPSSKIRGYPTRTKYYSTDVITHKEKEDNVHYSYSILTKSGTFSCNTFLLSCNK